jgi:hypothetical protein
MASATFLLPARTRFGGQALPDDVARALGRGSGNTWRTEGGPWESQLHSHFDVLPRGWPIAAVTRAWDANDAAPGTWVRADPAFVRPDLTGARLMATGDALQITAEEASQFIAVLRPLFGDAGMPIDAPNPARWYVRLPREAKLPPMASPEDALGADLFDCMPEGPEARRWRALLSEAQVALHQHPSNAARAAAGKPPVNSVWFWGGGVLPDAVTTRYAHVYSNEVGLRALAKVAGVAGEDLPQGFSGAGLYDLRAMRDLQVLARDWLRPAIDAVRSRTMRDLLLDFEGFHFLDIERRWGLFSKPLRTFDP